MFRDEKIILSDINGFVESGTMMALMGPSGAGKSTLLKALMGINRKPNYQTIEYLFATKTSKRSLVLSHKTSDNISFVV